MDFGKSIRKRAQMIDKKLDEIVPNPYANTTEVKQSSRSHRKVNKPLFVSLGAVLACACISLGIVGLVQIVKNNTYRSRPIINPNYNVIDAPEDTTPYQGRAPKLDINNYVSINFGFPEFSYFSFFAKNKSQTSMMAPNKNVFEDEEIEYTTMSPMESYYGDDGKIHNPLPIYENYKFGELVYFEFINRSNSFVEEKVGTGHIEGLFVRTNAYDKNILIFKNGNKFYSCLGEKANFDSNGMPVELTFAGNESIDGWDIVEDENKEVPISIYFNSEKGYEGAYSINIDGSSLDIKEDSVYYIHYTYSIPVNEVRKFIGLAPDPKFENVTSTNKYGAQEIEFKYKTTFTLEEFGSYTFDYEGTNNKGEPVYTFGDVIFILEGYYWKNSYFIYDLNRDGYRDFIYSGKNDSGYYPIVYDFHNEMFITGEAIDRNFYLWYTIKNNSLLAIKCNKYDIESEDDIHGYADIIWNSNYSISLEWLDEEI